MKIRRIPLGLFYVASLIAVVVTIPLIQSVARQPFRHGQQPLLSEVRVDQTRL